MALQESDREQLVKLLSKMSPDAGDNLFVAGVLARGTLVVADEEDRVSVAMELVNFGLTNDERAAFTQHLAPAIAETTPIPGGSMGQSSQVTLVFSMEMDPDTINTDTVLCLNMDTAERLPPAAVNEGITPDTYHVSGPLGGWPEANRWAVIVTTAVAASTGVHIPYEWTMPEGFTTFND